MYILWKKNLCSIRLNRITELLAQTWSRGEKGTNTPLSRRPESVPCTNTRCHFKPERGTVCPTSTNSGICQRLLPCTGMWCSRSASLARHWLPEPAGSLQMPPEPAASVCSKCFICMQGRGFPSDSSRSPKPHFVWNTVIRCYLTKSSSSIIIFCWSESFECFVLTKNRS